MTISKSQLRKHFREIRKHVSDAQRKEAAISAASYLVAQDFFKHSVHIACYLPVRDEFDTSVIIHAIWEAKKQCYLPILGEDKHALHFVRYEKDDALHLNHYSIPEPINISREIVAEQLDLVIVPLIAFDSHGYRLGTGGGYYDYTFQFLKNNEEKKPFLLGLGYAEQYIEKLPTEAWDIQLNAVLTEKTILKIKTY